MPRPQDASSRAGTAKRLQSSISNQAMLRLQQSTTTPSEMSADARRTELPSAARRGLQGPSTPLEPAAARTVGARLGVDFSNVQIHTDATAGSSARALGAKAYTFGNHVV